MKKRTLLPTSRPFVRRMNRRAVSLIVGALFLPLGCGDSGGFLLVDRPVDPSPVLQPSELCSDNPSTAIATFEDGNLMAAVRSNLGLGSLDDLTCSLLRGLTILSASTAGIVSLVGIQNLTGLTFLQLDNNSITDISALSGLTSLTGLFLDDNTDLSNIQPLLDNTGLEAGDNVGLTNTGVSCTDVAALQAKGVTVSSDCP